MRKISHQKETFLPGETYPLTIDVNEAQTIRFIMSSKDKLFIMIDFEKQFGFYKIYFDELQNFKQISHIKIINKDLFDGEVQ